MINNPCEIVLVAGRHAPREVMRRTIGAGRGGCCPVSQAASSAIRTGARAPVSQCDRARPFHRIAIWLCI
jgi:hypothetical protein